QPDMAEMSWNPSIGDPDHMMYMLLSSDRFPPAFNSGYYQNDRVDDLLRRARTTLDEKARVPLYKEAQKLVVEDAPWIFVDHGKQVIVHRKRVQGFKLHPNFDLVLTPVALAERCLDRLETVGGKLNAVVTLTPERALEQARRAERELAAGHDRGPLHGIPYGAKDVLATSGGIPTTWGAAPFRDRCFDYDATVIRRLEESGAVLVAKLAMVELAGGMGYRQPHASFTGPGISPWASDAWSGGSSSGSGSAVGAGLVPFAIGSETWGSILSPAAYCGVTGLRPT